MTCDCAGLHPNDKRAPDAVLLKFTMNEDRQAAL
jgi:hypothetical protein